MATYALFQTAILQSEIQSYVESMANGQTEEVLIYFVVYLNYYARNVLQIITGLTTILK